MKLLPLRHKVVLISRQSDTPSRDFVMLAEELQRRDPRLEIAVVCRTLGEAPLGQLAYLPVVLAQVYHLATSRVCITDGYVIPVSVLHHRPELTVIQLWHALGAIKRFGYQCLDTPAGRPSRLARAMCMHANYDVVLCGGVDAVPVFAEAFNIAREKVLPLGLPRIDYLMERAEHLDEAAASGPLAELIGLHPGLLDGPKKRVLYAPTFRKGHATSLQALAGAFDPERFLLIAKLHDLERGVVEHEHVIDATGISVLDLLPLCDVVITDYSAVAFEGYALGKPVYYYVYDIEEYSVGCGLNIDPLRDAPRVSSTDIEEIARWIGRGEYDEESASEFRSRYLPSPLPGSTARIAGLVLERLDTVTVAKRP